MHIYDYSFLAEGSIPVDISNMAASIYGLKSGNVYRKETYKKIFTELEKIAKVQSVKNSNAIEGIVSSDQRIIEIVTRSSAPLNHNEEEIAGYRDALDLVHSNYEQLQFNERTILELHKVMLTLTPSDFGGQYKTDDNAIIEVDQSGNRKIRFMPVSAEETERAMEQLVLAFQEAKDDYRISPLLLIPCVILDFLCIHPFRDGNGRISRLLTLLLLYKAGFDAGKYISFEEQINNHKLEYYEDLRLSSLGWHDNQNDYMPFVRNFLLTLYMCYKELDKRFAVVNGKKATKTSRIETTVLNALTPISKSEICAFLPDVSPTTVEAVLARMVKSGSVVKIGSAKNTKYLRA